MDAKNIEILWTPVARSSLTFSNIIVVVVVVFSNQFLVNFKTGIKTFQALTTLVKEFPKQMAPHLMDILPHMWNTLTQSADRYVRTVVNYTDDADDPVDSDGKKHNYFKLST